MRDLLDDLDLRGICGPTASLDVSGGSWRYRDGDLTYLLTHGDPARLDIWRGVNHLATTWGDISTAFCREEAALAASGGNPELEAVLRRDLFRFRMGVEFAAIDAWLLEDLDSEPGEHEGPPTLLVRGLDPEGRSAVASVAQLHGATVLVEDRGR